MAEALLERIWTLHCERRVNLKRGWLRQRLARTTHKEEDDSAGDQLVLHDHLRQV